MNHASRLWLPALLATLLGTASGALAQGPAAPQGGTAWHVVRPGDTLEGISRRYLGTASRWPEIWRLNPEIQDPNVLVPWQRVRISLVTAASQPVARVTRLAREVESKPQPNPWDDARVDDLLRDLDGVRTRRQSSAELLYTDGKRLVVTESSLVFLRQVGGRLEAVPRDEIEIVDGQADLAGVASAGERLADVEIFVGEARLRPEAGAAGSLETRARKADAGAQLMVYEGEGVVVAAGERVELARGTGTSVPAGGAPAPPEELLPAPEPASPAAGSSLAFANPTFAWRPVEGAASYVLEICADPGCGALVRRVTDIAAASWTPPEGLPTGDHHWRATAVSASELDGYPGETVPFSITGDRVDREPPRGSLRASGPAVRFGTELVLGPGAHLEAELEDAASGVGEVEWLLDGAAVPQEKWAGPWSPGAHEASVTAADRVGHRATLEPLSFVSDSEPPAVTWERGGPALVARHGDPAWQPREVKPRRVRRVLRRGVLLEWSADGQRWLPLSAPWAARRQDARWADDGRTEAHYLGAGHPQVLLRAPGGNPGQADNPLGLGSGEILRLAVEDRVTAVRELRWGVGRCPEGGAPARAYLWAEAIDLLGNVTRSRYAPACPGEPPANPEP